MTITAVETQCPAWCALHDEGVHRARFGDAGVELAQNPDSAPRIYVPEHHTDASGELTLEVAEHIAAGITSAITATRMSGSIMLPTAAGCPDWCRTLGAADIPCDGWHTGEMFRVTAETCTIPRSIETADTFDVQLCRVDPRAGVDDGARPLHVSLVVQSNGVPGREGPLLAGRLSAAEARALGAALLQHADLVDGESR